MTGDPAAGCAVQVEKRRAAGVSPLLVAQCPAVRGRGRWHTAEASARTAPRQPFRLCWPRGDGPPGSPRSDGCRIRGSRSGCAGPGGTTPRDPPAVMDAASAAAVQEYARVSCEAGAGGPGGTDAVPDEATPRRGTYPYPLAREEVMGAFVGLGGNRSAP